MGEGLKRGFVAFLKDTIAEYNIEFVGIHETMLQNISTRILRRLGVCGNFSWHWLPSKCRYGGILG
jgi:hypothetical protein